jgi:LuxR family maltose regulon positive regulatory protein
LSEAQARYDTDYSPKARPVSAIAARVRLAAGDLAGATQWAAESGLTTEDDPAYLRDYEQLTLARVLLGSGRTADAAHLLQRLLPTAEAGHRSGTAIEALLLLALSHQASGDTARALAALGDALTRAEPEGFVRVVLDAGPGITPLLQAAVRHHVGGEGRAAALLAAGTTPRRVPAHQRLVDELSSRELDVLRLLRSELTGPQIAAELVVSINTVRTHTKNIFMKLGVTSRRAAVRRADDLGL